MYRAGLPGNECTAHRRKSRLRQLQLVQSETAHACTPCRGWPRLGTRRVDAALAVASHYERLAAVNRTAWAPAILQCGTLSRGILRATTIRRSHASQTSTVWHPNKVSTSTNK
jgi:hypothetical protein